LVLLLVCYLTVSVSGYGSRKSNPNNRDVGDSWPYNGPDWESKSGEYKQQQLWQEVISDDTPQGWYSAARMPELFIEDMSTTMDFVGDNMPQQGLLGVETRPKLIHSQGSVVPVIFYADSTNKYTGIFQAGDYGLFETVRSQAG